jgi:hypothetical protein
MNKMCHGTGGCEEGHAGDGRWCGEAVKKGRVCWLALVFAWVGRTC